MTMREQFEAAVIKRMKESGFLEVEIRVECLGRSGDGYQDGSIDAYWHFWQESRASMVIELPKPDPHYDPDAWLTFNECKAAIDAQGLKVAL